VPIDQADPADDPGVPDRPRPPDNHRAPDTHLPRLAEAADRAAAHHAYRAKVEQVYSTDRSWTEAIPALRAAWGKHQEQYPEQARVTPQTHPDKSWSCGDARKLSPDQNTAVDRGFAGIREIGERDIVPKMLALEVEDPSRRLAGFDHHVKGADRLKEKIADRILTRGQTPDQALAQIPDAVRFTFQYDESRYAAGVRDDVKRLEGQGFVQVERRNTWEDEQYKGINSRWREPESRMLFEVQFHTKASLEAKELTHQAYERIRSTAQDDERVTLKEFQRRVNSMIPIPPGAAEIEDYPPGGK
jgi:hypothetical protein